MAVCQVPLSPHKVWSKAGPALAWVPLVHRNPQIFQQVYKEPTEFEEGKLSLLGEAKSRNPRIEIPNAGPAKFSSTDGFLSLNVFNFTIISPLTQ